MACLLDHICSKRVTRIPMLSRSLHKIEEAAGFLQGAHLAWMAAADRVLKHRQHQSSLMKGKAGEKARRAASHKGRLCRIAARTCTDGFSTSVLFGRLLLPRPMAPSLPLVASAAAFFQADTCPSLHWAHPLIEGITSSWPLDALLLEARIMPHAIVEKRNC